MKIQFAVIDPGHVSGTEGKCSVVMGIAKTKELMNNYDLKFLSIGQATSLSAGVLIDSQDNLLKRDQDITFNLHSMLTKPIWERIEAIDNVAGEVTFLKTQSTEPDAELPHTYIFLGLVSGENERIRSISGQILEMQYPSDPEPGQPRLAPIHMTGRKATHIMGSHFTSLFGQVIWGWGEDKRGMRYLNSEEEALKTFSATKRYLETGQATQEMAMVGVSRDPEYLRFLRRMEKLEPMVFMQWETQSERDHKETLASQVLNQDIEEFAP